MGDGRTLNCQRVKEWMSKHWLPLPQLSRPVASDHSHFSQESDQEKTRQLCKTQIWNLSHVHFDANKQGKIELLSKSKLEDWFSQNQCIKNPKTRFYFVPHTVKLAWTYKSKKEVNIFSCPPTALWVTMSLTHCTMGWSLKDLGN